VLGLEVLPELAAAASDVGHSELRCWSAGCASGEEPHTVRLVWETAIAAAWPAFSLSIVGTDVDEHLLARAARARYATSSLHDLPEEWRLAAFREVGEEHELRPEYREGVRFVVGDLRREVPEGRFGLVLCRNLAFTYYDEGLQREVLARLVGALRPGGALVIGRRERLPEGDFGVALWDARNGVYRAG